MGTGQKRLEGQVGRRVLLAPAQLELLASIAALEPDRDENERRVADVRGVGRVDPFQRAEGKVQDVDALLLLERTGIRIELQQPLLQALGCQPSLQLRIGMAIGNPALIDPVILGLGEIVDLLRVRSLGVASPRAARPARKVKALFSRTSRRKTSAVSSSRMSTVRALFAERGMLSSRLRAERSSNSVRARSSFVSRGRLLWKIDASCPPASGGFATH